MTSIVAREAIAVYRREPMLAFDARVEEILRRLEADPDGKVSAALNRLRQVRTTLLIFNVLQAADLAQHAKDIGVESRERADKYKKAANEARHLAAFCPGRAPIELWTRLAELADFLDAQGKHFEEIPSRLQIRRTAKIDTGPAILALRHLGRKLRDEFKMAHPPHKALAWLVEVALDLDRPLSPHVVADALRQQMGVQSHRKAANSKGATMA